MKNRFFTILGAFVMLSFFSCTDKVNQEEFHYSDEEFELLSQTLDIPAETFAYPIVTNSSGFGGNFNNGEIYHKATLGRVLFYDKMLSIDESTSCASCHVQENAFAEARAVSIGINETEGQRNSLPLGNTIGFVRYYGTDLSVQSGFFSWDESQLSINSQSEAAITSPKEMGHSMYELGQKINEQEYYQILFKKVYGSEGATKENILDAITEFVNSMTSRESKFDEGAASNNVNSSFTNFTASENNGKSLFNDNCSSCHGSNHNAIVLSSANNGLDLVYEDKGLGNSGNASLRGVFKVPSLRNIELTGPYMHDGRFETIDEVIEHYSSGIKDHDNLHFFLKNGNNPRNFNFTSTQKVDLKNYLLTLTDENFVTNVKYSDPFKS